MTEGVFDINTKRNLADAKTIDEMCDEVLAMCKEILGN